MHVERTFTVSHHITDVFDYFSDFTRTEQWDPGTLETTRTSGDGGLGTTYRNRSTFMGRTVTLTYTTVAFDRPHFFSVRGVNGKTTTSDTLTFAPEADGTRIHYRAEFDFPFPLSVVAPLVLRRKLDDLADETVAQMKSAVDSL